MKLLMIALVVFISYDYVSAAALSDGERLVRKKRWMPMSLPGMIDGLDQLAEIEKSPRECWSKRENGKTIVEGHGDTSECYPFLEALDKCEEAVDCFAVATHIDICGGDYRVTHGTPTKVDFKYYLSYNVWIYNLDRRCLGLPEGAIQPTNQEPISCWSDRLEGKYIEEGHGATDTCYDLEEAKEICKAADDCHGIATQSNICGGRYRVSHGETATLLHWDDWKTYNLWAYTFDRECEAMKPIPPPLLKPTSSAGNVGCWSAKQDGKYIVEGHGDTDDCYGDAEWASLACEEAEDCHGITRQSNICGGWYRVSHGKTATLRHYDDWKPIGLHAYTYDRSCSFLKRCWTERLVGKWIVEGHGETTSCYGSFDQAVARCEKASNCHGIAKQSNVCGGRWRVSFGSSATLMDFADWRNYDMWAFVYDPVCASEFTRKPCKDTSASCPVWQGKGLCATDFMVAEWCRLSCKRCNA